MNNSYSPQKKKKTFHGPNFPASRFVTSRPSRKQRGACTPVRPSRPQRCTWRRSSCLKPWAPGKDTSQVSQSVGRSVGCWFIWWVSQSLGRSVPASGSAEVLAPSLHLEGNKMLALQQSRTYDTCGHEKWPHKRGRNQACGLRP